MKKAVIFDMDGLMFDTESLYFKGNRMTAESVGIPFDYAFYENYIGSSDDDLYQGMYQTFEKEKVDAFIERAESDVEDVLFSSEPVLKEGLVPLLNYLKENHFKTVVASSSRRKVVQTLLKNANLTHYFDAIVGGDEVEVSKPHPEIFQKAAALTGYEQSEIVVLEDSMNGIRAAHAAGIDVIMVPDLIQPTDEARKLTLDICNDLHEILRKIKNGFRF